MYSVDFMQKKPNKLNATFVTLTEKEYIYIYIYDEIK